MGLFSPKKTTAVASSVWNMAGDIADRPNILKTTVVSSVLQNAPSLGENIVNAHLNGPGINQRLFYRWSLDNWQYGLPNVSMKVTTNVDAAIIASQITTLPGETLTVTSAFIDAADHNYFAEKHILETNPELLDTAWEADYDDVNETMIITYEDTTTEIVSIAGFDEEEDYLVAYYFVSEDYSEQAVVEGALLLDEQDINVLTDVTSYTLTDGPTLESVTPIDLIENTLEEVTYSDGRPDESTSNDVITADTYNTTFSEYQRETYQGPDGTNGREVTLREIHKRWEKKIVTQTVDVTVENEDIGGGVTRTTTTTVTTDVLVDAWDHQDDTQEIYQNEAVNGTEMIVYRMNSGNVVFDALEGAEDDGVGDFFPFIPLRINERFYNNNYYSETYQRNVRRVYRKATDGANLDKLIDQLADNPDIGDVDHIFMVYGVSLNTVENAGRVYMYDFFKEMESNTTTSFAEYSNFQGDVDSYNIALEAYDDWYDAQADPNDPLYQTPSPGRPSLANPRFTTLRLRSDGQKRHDFRLSWIAIGEESFAGVYDDMKIGDVRLETGAADAWEEGIATKKEPGDRSRFVKNSINTLYMYRQVSATLYTRLTIKGLVHQNYVYKGRRISIGVGEALNDPEESGFIIPLHYPTVRKMSIVDSTQLSTCNTYLVFNSYEVVKQKWWQTGLFKILLVIAVVVVTVVFAPAGAAAATGVLGTNAAVGAAIGLSGVAGVIAGAIANAIAAMVLTNIITEASVKLFGEKWGEIIGFVLGMITLQGLTNLAGGNGFFNWGNLMRADNIIALSNVSINAYAKHINEQTQDLIDDALELKTDYEKEAKEISDLIHNLGYSGVYIDPTMFTEIANSEFNNESSDQFLNRTTMTGDDVVEISHRMVYDFVDINLRLPEPT